MSYTAPCELHCTLWAALHPVSHAAPHWTELYSTELCRNPSELYHTLLSWAAPSWPPPDPSELCYNLFNYAAPYRMLCCTLQNAMLHLTECFAAPYRMLCCTSQSYVAPHRAMLHLTVLPAIHRAMMHPTDLAAPTELHCTLLSYGAPCWATVHPAELRGTPYGLAQPNWATLHPTELHCTPLCYAVPHWATLYPTELPNTLWATLYPTS